MRESVSHQLQFLTHLIVLEEDVCKLYRRLHADTDR